jgi:hypothetical protein
MAKFNGVSFFDETRDTVYIYTDACRVGMGDFIFQSNDDLSGKEAVSLCLVSPEFTFAEPFDQLSVGGEFD